MNSCPFCAIIQDEAEATIVMEYGDTIIIEPLNPVTEGHLLVIPCEHVVHASVDPKITGRTFEVAAEYMSRRGPYNLITSIGPSATQTVEHLHVHIVPRRLDDGLKLPWTDQVIEEPKVIEWDGLTFSESGERIQ